MSRSPSDIEADPLVRVVFFKSSLNTGWDCPRAEVMMSFRTAADSTHIAQLVGRMVRTPLARRIIDNETLNTVSLYLPHYDAKGLQKVVAKLSKPDDEALPPVDIQDADDVVELVKSSASERCFAVLQGLPSYVVPRQRKANQVRRLMKFARLLTNDGVDEEALENAKGLILKALNDEYNRVNKSERFRQIVDERSQIEIEAVNWDVGTDGVREGEIVRVDIATENVDDLFEATGRKLTEGLHKAWWREHVNADLASRERAKLELFALCIDPELVKKLERIAQETVQLWLKEHADAIAGLEEGSRAAYSEVRNLAASPELVPLVYPATIQSRQAVTSWTKHLYSEPGGSFPCAFNKSESALLKREIEKAEVLGGVTSRKGNLCRLTIS